MKRILAGFAACAVLLASGCGLKPQLTGKMQLDEVKLTNRERAIAQAAGGAKTFTIAYKFVTDGRCRTICLDTYEMIDGAWQVLTENGSMSLEPTERDGILALSFYRLEDGVVNVALSTNNVSGTISYEKPNDQSQPTQDVGRSTSLLNDNNVLEYETPMAVAVQTVSESGTVTGHDVSQFNAPESVSLAEGERLLALVVTFSTEQQT